MKNKKLWLAGASLLSVSRGLIFKGNLNLDALHGRKAASLLLSSLGAMALHCFFAAGTAEATTYNFTYAGSCAEACAAYASITPGNGTLLVALADNEANPASAGDILSGVQFTVSAAKGSVTLSSQSGSLIDVVSDNTPVSVAGSPTHWGASASSLSTGTSSISLATAGSAARSGKPIDMIIGGPGVNGTYTGNSSVANFDPYINGTGIFLLIDSNIMPNTVISTLSFMFGTTPDFTVTGTSVPEPASLGLMISALAGLAMLAFQTRRRPRLSSY